MVVLCHIVVLISCSCELSMRPTRMPTPNIHNACDKIIVFGLTVWTRLYSKFQHNSANCYCATKKVKYVLQ
jgi:hypothetical protein